MTVRAVETSGDGTGERPLRRDAERNRQRILTAAAAVFTERGLDATLDEVARVAGVGVGTVYRRFPDKESLIRELFRERIDALVTVAEQSCTAADPWQGLASYLEFAAAAMADDLGLRQLMMFGTYDREQVCYARDRMRPVITRLVRRAQASGDLRADFEATDVKMIAFRAARAPHPDARKRRPRRLPAGPHVHPHENSAVQLSGAFLACTNGVHKHQFKPFGTLMHVHAHDSSAAAHPAMLICY